MKLHQWWIVWKSGYKNQATVTTEKPFTYNSSIEHVVRYSSYEKACKERDEHVTRIASLEAQLEKAEKVIEKTMNFPMLQGESGHLLREYFAEKEKNGN